ncbi:MAG: hypothetical protein QOC42_03700, partial [Nitrososphaeraceae archaeon]|nr:hypothetical protein [Nitrososphaeraceae archaeon]
MSNKAQTLEQGIHGISNVPNVKITGVTISINLIYNGTVATSPAIIIVANALTNRTDQVSIERSQVLSEGWISPN